MPDEPSSPSSSPTESAEARLARLDALASDLFDGEPVSAEEALVRLHQEVVQVLGAAPAPKASPEPEPIQLPADAFEGFEGMEWMDDVRVWRGALLALVGGRTQELLEQWGEEYHAEALRAGGGDSAWFDNLSAPLQARWIALVRERQIMRRAQAHHDRRAAQRRSDAALFGEEAPAEPTGAEAEVLRLNKEICGALDLIPASERVQVREGGGAENVVASLVVSLARLAKSFTAERKALASLRTYINRSIADDLSPDEVCDILDDLPPEDMAAVKAWASAMADPAYWSKEVAQLLKEREQAESLDGLLALLDKLWPEDIWPAGVAPDEGADPGSRLVRVARAVARLEKVRAAAPDEPTKAPPVLTLQDLGTPPKDLGLTDAQLAFRRFMLTPSRHAPDMGLLGVPFPLPEQPREGGTHALGGPDSPGPGTLVVNTDPPDLSTVGLRARWAREVSGLSMGQAARVLGMSVAALSAYEVGNLDPDGDSPSAAARLIPIPDDLLGRMADTYGVRLSFLRTGHLAEPSAEDQAGLTKLTPKDAESLARFLGAVGSDTP